MIASRSASPLVQRQLVTRGVGPCGADFLAAYDGNGMDCRVDVRSPILKELVQLGVLRGAILESPDEALQQCWEVRHVIQDLRSGETIPVQLKR